MVENSKSCKERKAKAPKKKNAKTVLAFIPVQTDVQLRNSVAVERWIPVIGAQDVKSGLAASVEDPNMHHHERHTSTPPKCGSMGGEGER